jgi:hypothetical protein
MRAYWRDDLQESGDYPASSEKLKHDEWALLDFEVMETPCEDFITDEGFNMIIKHPITERLIFVCSIDFNFKHYRSL